MRLTAWFSPAWRHGLGVSAICTVFGLISSVFLLNLERTRLTTDAGTQLAGYARMVAERLDSGLASWVNVVSMLARFEVFGRQPSNPDLARHLLEDIRSQSTAFAWIGFVDAAGQVIAATDRQLEGADVSGRSWFRQTSVAPSSHAPAVGWAALLPESADSRIDAQLIDVAAAVQNGEGQFIGIIAGRLTWRWAESVRREVTSMAPWQPAPELRVLDVDGVVLLGPENEQGSRWVDAPRPDTGPSWQEATFPGQPASLFAVAPLNARQGQPHLDLAVVARRDIGTIVAKLWPFGILLSINTFGVALLGGVLAGWHIERVASALDRVLGCSRSRDVMKGLEQLRDQAWRDPLTGMLNRAGFQAWQRTQPDLLRGCAVVVLDLDGFKPINDLHGHAAGDAVLRGIGLWLRQSLRAQDAAVRLGGDEFVLCLPGEPGTIAEAALEVDARLNALLQDGLPTPAGKVRLGCSTGFARVPLDAASIEEAIGLADAALYEAKRRRRDPVSARFDSDEAAAL